MQPHRPEAPTSALNLNSVLYAIFRHKWLILACAALGVIAAIVVNIRWPLTYQSTAKLLVRYVLDRSTVDPIDGTARSGGRGNEGVLGSEAEILTSWDLALQVAEALGPQMLLPNAGPNVTKEQAAASVSRGLQVGVRRGSNIIVLSYQNPRAELTTPVLNELMSRYFTKHLEVHRSAGAFDFVSQQTDQVRSRLNQTEDALRSLKAKVGIVSLPEATGALTHELTRTEEQIYIGEATIAEQRARVEQLEKAFADQTGGTLPKATSAGSPAASPGATPGLAVDPEAEDVAKYRTLVARIAQVRQAELTLLSKFTEANTIVELNRAEMADLQKQKREMETKFPGLIETADNGSGDLLSERAKLSGFLARVAALKGHVVRLRERLQQLSEVAPQILNLERKREMEEASYRYFEQTLEKARVDEALDSSKIPNISAVQKPSLPSLVTGKRDRIVMGLAGGGLGLGIALAVLFEMLLSRTVKRPAELETQLRVPLLLTIPYAGRNGHRRLLPSKPHPSVGANGNSATIAPWNSGHFIRKYSEAIRDRLGLYFELHDLTHKPKLIGVTGFSEGAGTSTLAAGLAASLSEVGDGKVLLVDVNLGPHQVHPFFKGQPAVSLTNALKADSEEPPTSAAENLYLATVAPENSGLAQLGLKRFFDMMPNLKASDFDYIVFDMPPLTQTSPTLGMAGFMDKVLLVVEAEESNRDVVKRGYTALAADRKNVSVVLNKARNYLPKWLDGDQLD